MSNDEFVDELLDATMKRIYETFGKPGANENPPRNYRCGRCQMWITDDEWRAHDGCWRCDVLGGKP